MTPLTIAVSKGRIFKEALPLLAHAGIRPLEDPEKTGSAWTWAANWACMSVGNAG